MGRLCVGQNSIKPPSRLNQRTQTGCSLGELDTQYAYFSHRQPTLEESFCFVREQCLEMLRGLLVAATLKVSRTQTSLTAREPEILGLLVLFLSPQHLLLSAGVETSQQNISLLDLSVRHQLRICDLMSPCLQLTLRHWEDSWEWQFNFKGNANCKCQICNSEEPLFYMTPATCVL